MKRITKVLITMVSAAALMSLGMPSAVAQAPTITSFFPTSGPVGTSVTISGTNFVGTTSVFFNITVASFTVNSSTQITAIVPSGATTGPITVNTVGGSATTVTDFIVVATAGKFHLEPTIAFTSTRDNLTLIPVLGAEIYLIKPVMNPDGTWALTNPRRLTNDAFGDGFANLSPDGKRIVFDSNRLTAGTVCDGVTYNNIFDFFLMNTDGTEQALLTRGGSTTWSPDSKTIAFQASASYHASGGLVTGCPIRRDPGSATSDSDIFAVNVDDLLAGLQQPTNITNSPDWIDEDPDWSPNGQKIVFTRHPVTDDPNFSNQAEIYLMNPDGTGLQQLTSNNEEERGPAWSWDGTRIAFACGIGGGTADFEICAMNADGTGLIQLTDNATFDGYPSFSPDGQQILFHRTVGVPGGGNQQLFIMNADGTGQTQLTFGTRTTPDGLNNIGQWGELRVKS